MQRRDLFVRIGSIVIAVPAALVAISACGGGDDDDDDADAAGPISFQVTSDGAGHTHALTVQCADLDGGNVTYTSGSGNGHTHNVSITMAQLEQIANGESVTVGITSPHTHNWVITKPANAC
jgi:hypothetical protein